MLTRHNIDIQAMLVWLTLPFYDFCGFRSVAVNSVYKLHFLHLFPIRRGNFDHCAINKGYIAYFLLRMCETAMFSLPI